MKPNEKAKEPTRAEHLCKTYIEQMPLLHTLCF